MADSPVWECYATVHSRPTSGPTLNLRYGFIVLRNGRKTYQEQASSASLPEALDAMEETIRGLMEAETRAKDAQSMRSGGMDDAMRQRFGNRPDHEIRQLIEREHGYGPPPVPDDLPPTMSLGEYTRMREAQMGIPPENQTPTNVIQQVEHMLGANASGYQSLMSNLEAQVRELTAHGITPHRIYLSDRMYWLAHNAVVMATQDVEEKEWWKTHIIGQFEVLPGMLLDVYRVPDSLQAKGIDIQVTYGDLEEQARIVELKQRNDALPDPADTPQGDDHPAWEFHRVRDEERNDDDGA